MEAESFFARWEKRNAEKREAEAAVTQPAPADEPPMPPPTLEEVAQLTPDADFTRFVARGVDENVRRTAMKKLFADPRFNVMDGLDVYIEDYNTFVPIPAHVLATLNHAKALLDPLAHLEHPVMRLIDAVTASDTEGQQEEATQAADASHEAGNADQDGDLAVHDIPDELDGQPQTQGREDNDSTV